MAAPAEDRKSRSWTVSRSTSRVREIPVRVFQVTLSEVCDADEISWVKNHGLCISFALRVASEAKLLKYIHIGDDGHHHLALLRPFLTCVYAAAGEHAWAEAFRGFCTWLRVKRQRKERLQDGYAQHGVSKLCHAGDTPRTLQSFQ